MATQVYLKLMVMETPAWRCSILSKSTETDSSSPGTSARLKDTELEAWSTACQGSPPGATGASSFWKNSRNIGLASAIGPIGCASCPSWPSSRRSASFALSAALIMEHEMGVSASLHR